MESRPLSAIIQQPRSSESRDEKWQIALEGLKMVTALPYIGGWFQRNRVRVSGTLRRRVQLGNGRLRSSACSKMACRAMWLPGRPGLSRRVLMHWLAAD